MERRLTQRSGGSSPDGGLSRRGAIAPAWGDCALRSVCRPFKCSHPTALPWPPLRSAEVALTYSRPGSDVKGRERGRCLRSILATRLYEVSVTVVRGITPEPSMAAHNPRRSCGMMGATQGDASEDRSPRHVTAAVGGRGPARQWWRAGTPRGSGGRRSCGSRSGGAARWPARSRRPHRWPVPDARCRPRARR